MVSMAHAAVDKRGETSNEMKGPIQGIDENQSPTCTCQIEDQNTMLEYKLDPRICGD